VFGSHPSFFYLKEFFPPRESDDFLISGVQAVCLAYLGNETGSYEVMCKARMKYGGALISMGKALGRRGQAVRREVLVMVLLMDCFEKLSKEEPHCIVSSSTLRDEATGFTYERTNQHEYRSDAETDADPKHLVAAIALCKLARVLLTRLVMTKEHVLMRIWRIAPLPLSPAYMMTDQDLLKRVLLCDLLTRLTSFSRE
jgi:hypothetical protein